MILMALFRPNQHFTQMQTPIRRARGLLYLFLYITKLPTTRVSGADQKLLNAFKAPWLSHWKWQITQHCSSIFLSFFIFHLSWERRALRFLLLCVLYLGNRHLIASPSLSGIVRTNKPTDGKLSSFVAHIA